MSKLPDRGKRSPPDRPAPVPAALTPEALEAWGDKLVARVAEAARTADAPGDEAAATVVDNTGRIEDAAARAAAAAERIDGGLEGTADRVTAEVEGGRHQDRDGIRGLRATTSTQNSRLVHRDCRRTSGHANGRAEVRLAGRFSVGLIVFGLRHADREPHRTSSTDGCETG